MSQPEHSRPWLAIQAEKNPHKQAIISDERKLTFRELLSEAGRIASLLQKHGITAGSHAAVASPNSVSSVLLIHALMLLKAVIVPVHIRQTKEEMMRQLMFADCTHIIVSDDVAFSDAPEKLKIIKLTELVHNEADYPDIQCGPRLSDSVLLMFTSGTSGNPKCVELTYGNMFYNALGTEIRLQITHDDSWLLSLPLYHIGGFSIIVRAVIFGISVIVPSGSDTDGIIDAFGKYNPSIVSLIPTVMQRLLEKGVVPNSRHKAILLGGGVITDAVIGQSSDKGWNIAPTYGTTETSSQIATLFSDNKKYRGSVGQPMPFTQVRIVDDTGMETATGEEGEITVRMPSLMKGYYKRKDLTSKVIRNDWYFTGDYGYVSPVGDLCVVSRRTDLIVSGGENINPYEIEELLHDYPGIDDVCIVPKCDPTWGEIVVAVVVAKDESITLYTVKDYLTGKIASFKIPKKLYRFHSIPYTETGKVHRAEVRKKISAID